MITIRKAVIEDHPILLSLAKTHLATKDFGHIMFSGEEAYQKGWIRVAQNEEMTIVGFTCFRLKSREPKTSLYYICVKSTMQHEGIGQLLLEDLMKVTEENYVDPCIELSCLSNNEPALKFYAKNGFIVTGLALKGKGLHLEKIWAS